MPPEMPPHVQDDPVACEAWTRIVAVMSPGTFTAPDEALLEVYSVGMSLMSRALEEISSAPLGGVRGGKSPALLVLRQATAQVSQALDRLGITRQERARLAAPNGLGDPRTSKFGDLLGQARI